MPGGVEGWPDWAIVVGSVIVDVVVVVVGVEVEPPVSACAVNEIVFTCRRSNSH